MRSSASFSFDEPTTPQSLTESLEVDEAVPLERDPRASDAVEFCATTLAHGLENLLAIVLKNSNLIGQSLPEHAAASRYSKTIAAAVRDARELTEAMRGPVRQPMEEKRAVDLNGVVHEAVALLQTTALSQHNLRVDVSSRLPAVPVVTFRIRQLLFDLLMNAAEACGPSDGRIRVSTVMLQLREHQIEKLRPQFSRCPGSYVRLRVVDNGCGVDESIAHELFTSRVSTKEAGRGLGLLEVGQTLRVHGGGVRLLSEPGRCTVVDVFLPLDQSRPDTQVGLAESTGNLNRRSASATTATILIADDTTALRGALGEYLGLMGYQVHQAAGGAEALAVLNAHPEVDLVMLDINMPDLDGYETMTALRARNERVPVVLMCGDFKPGVEKRFAPFAPAAFLAKPFALAEMKEVISGLVPTS